MEYIKRGGERGAGKDAAIAAGYSGKHAAKTAYDLLQLPKIAEVIDKERQDTADRNRIDADWVIERLKHEAEDPDNSGGERIRAIELLGKTLRLFVERKEVEHTHRSDFFASIDLSEEDTEVIEAEYRELVEGDRVAIL
ncbi:hypothetical protein GRI38_01750 [Altererythrobacter aurantiacus]|uniref:Terminase small subunit n=2 Tax=Parapontixanthobacter aurantiacus TaxID=1463599 RepID=A0A844ZAE0_9SPHN|nr:hypothetical protein [Parapontixanthobacter aurantiacus]